MIVLEDPGARERGGRGGMRAGMLQDAISWQDPFIAMLVIQDSERHATEGLNPGVKETRTCM